MFGWGPATRIYTLDLPRSGLNKAALALEEGDRKYISKERSGTRFAGSELACKITQLFGDSAAFDYSKYEGKQDFVFVDGAHSYEYVISDSHIALKLLKPGGGTVVWHDYAGWPGVTRALNFLQSSDDRFHSLRHVRGTSLCILEMKAGDTLKSTKREFRYVP